VAKYKRKTANIILAGLQPHYSIHIVKHFFASEVMLKIGGSESL